MDKEKVIKGLEEAETMLIRAVDRGGEMAVMGAFKCYNHVSDTLAMLKEQEAKCLTKAELDDLNENQFVWIEGRAGIYLYCLQIIGICRERTGVSDIQFNTPTCYVERSTDTYGKDYRIWTDKPTEEQRQVVKWNEID